MIKPLAFATILVSAVPTAAWSQGSNPPGNKCMSPYMKQTVLVQLDSTGISSWRFLNPRRPLPVVLPTMPLTTEQRVAWNQCAEQAVVSFANSASGQALVVTIPYTYRRINVPMVANEIDRQDDQVRAAENQLKLASEAANSRPAQELRDAVRNLVGQQPDAKPGLYELVGTALKQLNDLATERNRVTKAHEGGYSLKDALVDRDKMVEMEEEADKDIHRVILLSEKLRGAIVAWKTETAAIPDIDSGVVAAADRLQEELQRLEAWLQDGLSAVDFSTQRPPLSECSDTTAERQVCRYRFTLFDNGSFTITPETWRRLVRFSDGVVRFTVAFLDEQVPVSNSEGYLRVRSEVRERDSATTWSITAGVGYSVRPETDRKRPENNEARPFTLADPYTGGTLDAFNGSARLDLVQTLRDRARARVSPQFKEGILGEKENTRALTVPVYTVDVFGVNGISARFGKYTMFQPARRVAINVGGEGFQFNVRNVSIGHIVTQESATGVADKANQDSSVTVMRLSGARGFSVFRHVDVFALYGEKRKKEDTPYDYNTLGAQFFFADSTDNPQPNVTFSSFSGSVSYFHSDRDVGTQGSLERVDGTGSVWLLDAGVTWLRNARSSVTSLRTLGVLLGVGSGDDPQTTDRDESYLGETAGGFSGYESLFLSSFLSPLTPILQDGTPGRLPFGRGLANKSYVGVNYVERDFKQINLLWWIARAFQAAADAKAPATSLRAHWFRLDQPFQARRDAGFEAGLQWQIQLPEGVTTTLGCSRYFPGSATRRFFLVEPTSCSIQASLTLQ